MSLPFCREIILESGRLSSGTDGGQGDGKRSDDGSSGSGLVLGEICVEEPAEQVVGHRLQEVVDFLGYRQELRMAGGLDDDVHRGVESTQGDVAPDCDLVTLLAEEEEVIPVRAEDPANEDVHQGRAMGLVSQTSRIRYAGPEDQVQEIGELDRALEVGVPVIVAREEGRRRWKLG